VIVHLLSSSDMLQHHTTKLADI